MSGEESVPTELAVHSDARSLAEVGDLLPERYTDLGQIGVGGMGEVRRVRDRQLNRVVAMKFILPEWLDRPRARARFVAEAQATAQLQHPGIVPVHDVGRLPDGRAWFTMKEVRGESLRDVLKAARRLRPRPLTRLLGLLLRASEAVAYAHERGVIHRDLKPSNIMVGEHGEVLVLDWGLATITLEADEPVRTERAANPHLHTRAGTIAGSPMYMAPEQARGEEATPRSDVFALGTILYEILAAKRAYGRQKDPIQAVRDGVPEAPRGPRPLVALLRRTMAHDPDDRLSDAGQVAEVLRLWLEGAQREERARELVRDARMAVAELPIWEAEAQALRERARTGLRRIPAWAPETKKRPHWQRIAEAEALEQRIADARLQRERLAQAALSHFDLDEAHGLLAEHWREEHARTEAPRAAAALADHARRLGPDGAHHLAWLDGTGSLTLEVVGDPDVVELVRYVERHRRRVPEVLRRLATPIRDLPLKMGSYAVVADGIVYPFVIDRAGEWTGRFELPDHELGPDEVFVPAGPFRYGGDQHATGQVERAGVAHVDGFVIQRHPVTNAAYIAFLNDVARTDPQRALQLAPQERGTHGTGGAQILGFRNGCFHLDADDDGQAWLPDVPVVMLGLGPVLAYAAWLRERTGRPWRLPTEREWEKAARGVDGRAWPWGDHMDPSWSCMRESHGGAKARPRSISEFPVDCSVYGVRHLAGNVKTWCADAFHFDGPDHPDVLDDSDLERTRANRGGFWMAGRDATRICTRFGSTPRVRNASLGIRLVYSV